MSKWHILPLTIADQQQHINQSEKLLATIEPWHPVTLYWSMAEPAAIVLGFSQRDDLLNAAAMAQWKMPIYHRRAGGAAVLVGPQLLGLDVVLPAGHPLILADIVKSYCWLGEAWVKALRQFGVQARIVTPQEAHAQRALLKQAQTAEREMLLRRACYGALSPYEVVVGQRKVVGLDMIRRRAGSLLQAGVLLHWETEQVAQLLGHTAEEELLLRNGLLERAIGLDTLAGRAVTAQEVIAAFEQVIFEMEKSE
ncbi:MAG: ligase [Ktedonobacteraceae bacterium]